MTRPVAPQTNSPVHRFKDSGLEIYKANKQKDIPAMVAINRAAAHAINPETEAEKQKSATIMTEILHEAFAENEGLLLFEKNATEPCGYVMLSKKPYNGAAFIEHLDIHPEKQQHIDALIHSAVTLAPANSKSVSVLAHNYTDHFRKNSFKHLGGQANYLQRKI